MTIVSGALTISWRRPLHHSNVLETLWQPTFQNIPRTNSRDFLRHQLHQIDKNSQNNVSSTNRRENSSRWLGYKSQSSKINFSVLNSVIWKSTYDVQLFKFRISLFTFVISSTSISQISQNLINIFSTNRPQKKARALTTNNYRRQGLTPRLQKKASRPISFRASSNFPTSILTTAKMSWVQK